MACLNFYMAIQGLGPSSPTRPWQEEFMTRGSCTPILDPHTFRVQRDVVPRGPEGRALALCVFENLSREATVPAQA